MYPDTLQDPEFREVGTHLLEKRKVYLFIKTKHSLIDRIHATWVRGVMAIDVGCEFRGRSSIPSVCQITDADLGVSRLI